jgi:hypothetical protein
LWQTNVKFTRKKSPFISNSVEPGVNLTLALTTVQFDITLTIDDFSLKCVKKCRVLSNPAFVVEKLNS